nr:MAG TPA: PET assembly of cytochrome c oxidase, mitochondrial [Caudoviricetes sp.]
MICSGVVIVFTIGLIVGIYTSSKNLEKLANENIKQYQTIEKQKERIRELQHMKQLKEIYG